MSPTRTHPASTNTFRRRSSEAKYIAQRIYQRTGMALHQGANPLIRDGVEGRLRFLGLNSWTDYRAVLDSCAGVDELDSLIDSLSGKLTFFFRDVGQLEFALNASESLFHDEVTPLRVWSAPCSTGEEGYTLGILLSENEKKAGGRDWRIRASDLSKKAIRKAERAVYSAERLEKLPHSFREKYFEPCRERGAFRVSDAVLSRITFKCENLREARAIEDQFHILVCRNLLIYLDWHQQQALILHLSQFLADGGYLLLGDLESLNGLALPFQHIGQRVYQKQETVQPQRLDATERNLGRGYRLLVIDEAEPLLRVVRKFLTTFGFEVDVASNPSMASELVQAYWYDLLVVDLPFIEAYGMPTLSEFVQANGDCPVIVLTSMGYDNTLLNRALNDGAAMRLSKTLPIEQLAHGVRQCLQLH